MFSTIGFVFVLVSVVIMVSLAFILPLSRRSKSAPVSVVTPEASSTSPTQSRPSFMRSRRPVKPTGAGSFCLASAVQKELTWTPMTARSIYRKLRRQGIGQSFSVANIQAILDILTRRQIARCAVPTAALSGRMRRNHTTYRLAA